MTLGRCQIILLAIALTHTAAVAQSTRPATRPAEPPLYPIRTIHYRAQYTTTLARLSAPPGRPPGMGDIGRPASISPERWAAAAKKPQVVTVDAYLDCVAGRYRIEMVSPGPTGAPVKDVTVCDGQRILHIAESLKQYAYPPPPARTKMLTRARQLPKGLDWQTGLDRREPPARFDGRLSINGLPCTVWKQPFHTPQGPGADQLIVWLSSPDGLPVRTRHAHANSVDICDVLSCNEPFDDQRFSTDPPAGYTLQETPPKPKVYRSTQDLELADYVTYTLPDRSLIAAFRTGSRAPVWPDDALSRLKFGDEITTLHPWFDGILIGSTPAKVVARHLAVTRKDSVPYEWAVFIHTAPPPAWYDIAYEFQLSNGRLATQDALRIHTPAEFDEMVRGNMGELSDDGKAPAAVTYDAVMSLANATRDAANATTAPSQPAPAK